MTWLWPPSGTSTPYRDSRSAHHRDCYFPQPFALPLSFFFGGGAKSRTARFARRSSHSFAWPSAWSEAGRPWPRAVNVTQKRERTFRRIRGRGVGLDLNFDRAIVGDEITRLDEAHVIAEMAEARITGDEPRGNSFRYGNHQLGRAGRELVHLGIAGEDDMGGHIADLDDGVSAAPPLDGASRPRPQRGRGRQGTNGEESDGGAARVAACGTPMTVLVHAPFLFMGRMRPSLRRRGVLAKT